MRPVRALVMLLLVGGCAGCATQATLSAQAEMSRKLGKTLERLSATTEGTLAAARAGEALGYTPIPQLSDGKALDGVAEVSVQEFLRVLCAPHQVSENAGGAFASASGEIEVMDELAKAPPDTIAALAKSISSHSADAKKARDLTELDIAKARAEALAKAQEERRAQESECVRIARGFLHETSANAPAGLTAASNVTALGWLLSLRDLLKTGLGIIEGAKRAKALRAYAHVFRSNMLAAHQVLASPPGCPEFEGVALQEAKYKQCFAHGQSRLQVAVDYSLRLAVKESFANYGSAKDAKASDAERIARARRMADAMATFDALAFLDIDQKVLPKLKEAIGSYADAIEKPKAGFDGFFEAIDNLDSLIGAIEDYTSKAGKVW